MSLDSPDYNHFSTLSGIITGLIGATAAIGPVLFVLFHFPNARMKELQELRNVVEKELEREKRIAPRELRARFFKCVNASCLGLHGLSLIYSQRPEGCGCTHS